MVKFEAWRVQASVTHSLKGKPSRYQYRYNWYDITRSFRFEYGHNSYGNPFTSEIPNTHSEMHGDHGETPLRKCLLLAACFVPFLPKIGAFLGCTLLSQKGWPKCSLRTARPAFTLRPCFFHRHKWGSLVWPGRVASGNGNRPCQRLDLSIVWEERSTPEWEWRDIEYGSFWTYVIYVYIYIPIYIYIIIYIWIYRYIFTYIYQMFYFHMMYSCIFLFVYIDTWHIFPFRTRSLEPRNVSRSAAPKMASVESGFSQDLWPTILQWAPNICRKRSLKTGT